MTWQPKNPAKFVIGDLVYVCHYSTIEYEYVTSLTEKPDIVGTIVEILPVRRNRQKGIFTGGWRYKIVWNNLHTILDSWTNKTSNYELNIFRPTVVVQMYGFSEETMMRWQREKNSKNEYQNRRSGSNGAK